MEIKVENVNWRTAAFATAIVVLAFVCSAADKKQLTAALAAVEINLKTSEGKSYDEMIGKEFPAKYLASIKECKRSNPSSSTDPFDLFLKLDTEGRTAEALVYPETPMSLCSRKALAASQFSLRRTMNIGLIFICKSNDN